MAAGWASITGSIPRADAPVISAVRQGNRIGNGVAGGREDD